MQTTWAAGFCGRRLRRVETLRTGTRRAFNVLTEGDGEVRWAARWVTCHWSQRGHCFPTSGLGSSRSVLLGCMFCAMTIRASRSEVVSVLAFRLQGAAERRERKTPFSIEKSPWFDNLVSLSLFIGDWTRVATFDKQLWESLENSKLSPLFAACSKNVQWEQSPCSDDWTAVMCWPQRDIGS